MELRKLYTNIFELIITADFMLPSHTVWIIWQKVATISLLTKHWPSHVTGEVWSFHSGYDTMNFIILPWSLRWTWRQHGNILTESKGLTVRGEVSHPYKATGEFIVLWSAEVYRWKYTIHFSHTCLWISLDTFCYPRPRRFLSVTYDKGKVVPVLQPSTTPWRRIRCVEV
jgi:hypothetical protein